MNKYKIMGYESENLVTVKFITDHDTGMYHIGEVDGLFQEHSLKSYIKRFGSDELLNHMAFLTYQIIKARNEINSDHEDNQAKSCLTA